MNHPAEEEEPQNSGEDKLYNGFEQSALQQLPRPGMKKLHSAATTFPADP